MSVEAHKETLDFQAEVRQLMQLMIHSLYSNKEIFLRELISNASDAADKLRFEALADDALFEGDADLKIRIDYDKEARTITVRDNGIGMNRQEVLDNLGTIAKSGTREFFKALTGEQAKDAELIGQFGVGFYSSYIVADRVVVTTRRAGLTAEHGVRWESDGEGTFSIETVDRPQRGTEVVLHLREGEDELLTSYRLQSIIRRYSDHISLPILMRKEEEDKKTDEEETINQASALWQRNKKDVSDDEYKELYKHIAHDFEEPLDWVHSHVEGKQEYTSLFYIPKRAPFDLFDREQRHGVKLYVRRVFIMDDAKHLMPSYLRFVRGIVDSADLPLNVSREILQHNKLIDSMRSGSVKKVLGLLEGIATNDPEKYQALWKEFGRVLKEGPGEDFTNKERIAKLLRFASTHADTEEQNVSLDDYIGRMKEGQEKIYFITAETFLAAKNSPHLEVFRDKGIEVLLLSDRVDEWLVSHLDEFGGKSLASVTRGELDLKELSGGVETAGKKKKVSRKEKDLIKRIKGVLEGKVKEVRATERLKNSPACLVVDETDMSANLERMLKSLGQSVGGSKPILEINTSHPLVEGLAQEKEDARFGDWANILFDQALLAEGGQLEDPAGFVQRLNQLLLELAGKPGVAEEAGADG
ncbi:MAG: molecular chaperone HtpG [Proteobacteria bacterium]|nr:MAG: molecular chaperone HtpG [Pseudomonadota bacterium]